MNEYNEKLAKAVQSWKGGSCKKDQTQLEIDYSSKDDQELLYKSLGNDLGIYKNGQKALKEQYPDREEDFNIIEAEINRASDQIRIDQQLEQAISLANELTNNSTNDSSNITIVIDLAYLGGILSNLISDYEA